MKVSPCLKHYLDRLPMTENELKEAGEAVDDFLVQSARNVAMHGPAALDQETVMAVRALMTHMRQRREALFHEARDEMLRAYEAKKAVQAFELDDAIKAMEAADEEYEISDTMVGLHFIRDTYLKHVH